MVVSIYQDSCSNPHVSICLGSIKYHLSRITHQASPSKHHASSISPNIKNQASSIKDQASSIMHYQALIISHQCMELSSYQASKCSLMFTGVLVASSRLLALIDNHLTTCDPLTLSPESRTSCCKIPTRPARKRYRASSLVKASGAVGYHVVKTSVASFDTTHSEMCPASLTHAKFVFGAA